MVVLFVLLLVLMFFSIKNIIEIPAGGRTFGRLRLRRQMRTAQLGSCGSNGINC